jgi:hypothetical protein
MTLGKGMSLIFNDPNFYFNTMHAKHEDGMIAKEEEEAPITMILRWQ